MLEQIRLQQERKLGRVYVEENSSLNRLDSIFSQLSSKYDMDYDNLLQILKRRQSYVSVPASIFNNALSPLENVVLYLSRKLCLSQTEIANILNRDHTTIWTTLQNAKKKMKSKEYEGKESDILVPIHIFADGKLSVLESLSVYIKERFGLSYHEIAAMLGKDDRTIWTVVKRAKEKL